MATTEATDYATMLEGVREMIARAAGVEGASDIGAFFPIAKAGQYRTPFEMSSLSEWLDDVADALQDFVDENLDEIEGWQA